MKKLLLAALLLAGCSADGTASLQTLLQNPLYAEYYYNDLAERLAEIEIQKDSVQNAPILKDPRLLEKMRAAKDDALVAARAARLQRDVSATGGMNPVAESVSGQVMLLGSTLFTGPTFDSPPGPSLRLFLSEMVDPRDGEFPDASALDLGAVQDPYGPAAYEVPATEQRFRSVVLYDTLLKRMYGFAQLSYGPKAQ